MTNYELWQLEKYGNVLPDVRDTPDEELENCGIEELNRITDYINEKTQPNGNNS